MREMLLSELVRRARKTGIYERAGRMARDRRKKEEKKIGEKEEDGAERVERVAAVGRRL